MADALESTPVLPGSSDKPAASKPAEAGAGASPSKARRRSRSRDSKGSRGSSKGKRKSSKERGGATPSAAAAGKKPAKSKRDKSFVRPLVPGGLSFRDSTAREDDPEFKQPVVSDPLDPIDPAKRVHPGGNNTSLVFKRSTDYKDFTFERHPAAHKNGGWFNSDEAELKRQRAVVGRMLRNLMSNPSQAADLMNQSLPVGIFDVRSLTQTLMDNYSYQQFIKRGIAEKDPVERLKWITTFVFAGMHCTVAFDKPFNPALGETWQGEWADGATCFVEHTRHDPPTDHWEIYGASDMYKIHGWGLLHASLGLNKVNGYQTGEHVLTLRDGSVYSWTLPKVQMRGIMMGDRVFEFKGPQFIFDLKNNLQVRLDYDPPPQEKGSFWSTRSFPSDYVKGRLFRLKKPYGPDPTKDMDPQGLTEDICKMHGSWLGGLEIDGKTFWEAKTANASRPQSMPFDKTIPSDSAKRADIRHQLRNDMKRSMAAKKELEAHFKRERELRKRASNPSGHKSTVSTSSKNSWFS